MKYESAPTSEIKKGDLVVLGEELLAVAKIGFTKTEVDENTKFRVEECNDNNFRAIDLENGEVIDIRFTDLFPDKPAHSLVRKITIN